MDIILGLALSTHVGLASGFNSVHPHIRLEDDKLIAGAYYNSENRTSFYGGFKFEPINNLGIELGAVSGYPVLGDVIPYSRLSYDIDDNARIFIAPSGEIRNGETNIGVVLGVEIFRKVF